MPKQSDRPTKPVMRACEEVARIVDVMLLHELYMVNGNLPSSMKSIGRGGVEFFRATVRT
jgi:hypothetical protein